MASAITEIPQIPNVEQRYIEGKVTQNTLLNYICISYVTFLMCLSATIFQGRCLFATHPFKKGETIFVEDPIIACQFAWNKSYDYSACDHCMKYVSIMFRYYVKSFLNFDCLKMNEFQTPGNSGRKYLSIIRGDVFRITSLGFGCYSER